MTSENLTTDPVIRFQNVSKSYILYESERERFTSLFYKKKSLKRHLALDDVSFDIHRGESIGIIGSNGAGKSTLLKIVTGVTFPTSGDVDVVGDVAALLELTAGFSAEMTGRENIYLKGYILGYSQEEIQKIEGKIIDFAELGDYIDQPLRTYSSGMRMRLGFAINVNTDPDILVVDEALSVGDAYFRKKCNAKIQELVKAGVTTLFVSHSMSNVKELCSRVLYIKQGKIVFDGNAEKAIETYNEKVKKK